MITDFVVRNDRFLIDAYMYFTITLKQLWLY